MLVSVLELPAHAAQNPLRKAWLHSIHRCGHRYAHIISCQCDFSVILCACGMVSWRSFRDDVV